MSVLIPMTKIAHDADTLGAGRPGGKTHAGDTIDVVVVGAEYVVDTIVLAFAKKVQVVIANQRREAVRIDKPMPFAIVIVTHQFVMLRDSTAARSEEHTSE